MVKNNFKMIWDIAIVAVLILFPASDNAAMGITDSINVTRDGNGCTTIIHNFNEIIHKRMYNIGIFSSEGDEVVHNQYNQTFEKYLTETAGKKFDPPIEFTITPVSLSKLMELSETEDVDFFFASAAVGSCMEVEYKAQPLVTIINRRETRGHTYELDQYGGVMFTLADNDEVNTIEDFKDRTIGAGGITAMGGGQTQFYEMYQHGVSFVSDPKQVIFVGDERLSVEGVLNGEFEIGFARTDQIERHIDPNTGKPIQWDVFKVINTQTHILDDGTMFPFLSSTGLHPEWPVAALDHVSRDVSREVQAALLALNEHAASLDISTSLRCDTTPELAALARDAKASGMLAGFRTARTYSEVRTKQQVAGFMRTENDSPNLYCIRGDTLYEDLDCPSGYYKLTEEEFEKSCELAGLPCKEGYECFCKPCVKAFEVDVYQYSKEMDNEPAIRGCAKMSLCGTIQQNKVGTFRIVDHLERPLATVKALMHMEGEDTSLEVVRVAPFVYEFEWTENKEGVGILEVEVNGEQIPESPIQIAVVERDCGTDYPRQGKVAAEDGSCVCEKGTHDIRGRCVANTVFVVVGCVGALAMVGILACFIVRHKNRKADEVWHVNVDELHFDDPIQVIGQGAFGIVVLGQYRGTKVAVKRVIRPSSKSSSVRSMGSESFLDSSDDAGQHSIAKKARKRRNSISNKEVKFGDDTHDVENQKMKQSQSIEISGSFEWNEVLKPRKFNVLKLLDSVTNSNHGPSPFQSDSVPLTSSSDSASGVARFLPMCLRLDRQAKIRRDFIVEMRLLSRLRHPCITTVMGAVLSSTVDPMLVMEFMDYGSLHDLLRNETMYAGGEVILQIVRDIVQGIQFLHASKPAILHGDLKAKNILVDSRFRAKVADFGFSHINKQKTNTMQGTPFFMAPEYLSRKSEYTAACDIYSFSMILYEIYALKDPFEGEDPRKVLPKVCHPRINKRPEVPAACPPKMAEMMKKCWAANPFFRPSAKDLDYILVEMSSQEAEPLEKAGNTFKEKMKRKPTSLYDVFPKHIADALNAGQKVEPESHEMVTVLFSDIVGFTDISHAFTPLKVSQMLDRLYQAFDELAGKHKVFKVETVGDAYMAVTNLLHDQSEDHVKRAAEYAVDAIEAASKILIDEDAPERGCVRIRVGFHSGPVVSNVIGSLNPRYGLFGDTVNTASRMETNASSGKILCSHTSAKILETQAPDMPVDLRGKIQVKGKGQMMTYWVGNTDQHVMESSTSASIYEIPLRDDDHYDDLQMVIEGHDDDDKTNETEWSSLRSSSQVESDESQNIEDHHKHQVDTVSDILKEALKHLTATRPERVPHRRSEEAWGIACLEKDIGKGNSILEEAEASEFVPFWQDDEDPENGSNRRRRRDPTSEILDENVAAQLHRFVDDISRLHNNTNKFHGFDHVVHTMKAARSLISRIVVDNASTAKEEDDAPDVVVASRLVVNDKLAQFAVFIGALIVNIDYQGGISAKQDDDEPNTRYHKGKAVRVQNALGRGWEVFMRSEFQKLRECIYTTQDELMRFRKLLVKIVMSICDVFDHADDGPASEAITATTKGEEEEEEEGANQHIDNDTSFEAVSRRATILVGNLAQISYVSYTTQEWKIYLKWNRYLFEEVHQEYNNEEESRRLDHDDPTKDWYELELKLLDNTIIPIAKNLQDSFGALSVKPVLVTAVNQNRHQWANHGKKVVANLIKNQQQHN